MGVDHEPRSRPWHGAVARPGGGGLWGAWGVSMRIRTDRGSAAGPILPAPVRLILRTI